MNDLPTYIHYAISALTAICVAYLHFKGQTAKVQEAETVELSSLKLHQAVLESKVETLEKVVSRMDTKLDTILERI